MGIEIFKGFLPVDVAFRQFLFAGVEPGPETRKMSAEGQAWHSGDSETREPFIYVAAALTRSPGMLTRVKWWANALWEGARYRPHRHTGSWSFVYHLTHGEPVHFGEPRQQSYPAVPGQILVFEPGIVHYTDPVATSGGPRLSIAGNLWFSK